MSESPEGTPPPPIHPLVPLLTAESPFVRAVVTFPKSVQDPVDARVTKSMVSLYYGPTPSVPPAQHPLVLDANPARVVLDCVIAAPQSTALPKVETVK